MLQPFVEWACNEVEDSVLLKCHPQLVEEMKNEPCKGFERGTSSTLI
jgi:hypothetical protein